MVEPFCLLVIGLMIIGLRTYTRAKAVGFSNFKLDDYIMLIAMIPYSIEPVLAYLIVDSWKGLANSAMTDEERKMLRSESWEYKTRVLGSKVALAHYVLFTLVMWLMKGAMLAFCLRLTFRMGEYTRRIYFGFGFVVVTWLIVLLVLLLGCQPLSRYWQVYPDPGAYCHPGISPLHLFVTLSLNIGTDVYILGIPLPILWKANIKFWKKLGFIVLLCGNVFVIFGGCLRSYLIISNPSDGALEAGKWTFRLTFVSIVSTNLPVLFPLIWRWERAGDYLRDWSRAFLQDEDGWDSERSG
ncbi:hypothetical protein GGR56DRAFT_662892 [Xylariaceae sp. FL0804]|nr:hypothetical protein GGR56DRAFT_662892 [Xylariaceae sp. FL0804]